jgi:disulfide bond formation protein DsbB
MLPKGARAARLAQWLALLIPAGLLGGAYISQYGFGLFPCEMCWWQRYPHFAALPLAGLGLATRRSAFTWLAVLAIAVSAGLGALHAGVEYGWWQGPTACSSLVELGDDPLAAIMNTPMIRCDTPQWTLFGVSLAGFNFLISTGGALLTALLLIRSRGKA